MNLIKEVTRFRSACPMFVIDYDRATNPLAGYGGDPHRLCGFEVKSKTAQAAEDGIVSHVKDKHIQVRELVEDCK